MPRMTRYEFLQCTAAASALASLATAPAISSDTTSSALDRFIAAPDPYFDYKLVSSVDNPQYRVHVLELTSQQWRSAREVDRPLWKHWLTIIEPHEIRTDIGAMIIAGGSNADPPPANAEGGLTRLALSTYSIVCNLNGVPNQPLTFSDEHQPRSEDDLIAYSW